MRIFVVIFTALLALGLGVFGAVVAQRATGPAPLMSSSKNTPAAPKAAATEAALVAGAAAFRVRRPNSRRATRWPQRRLLRLTRGRRTTSGVQQSRRARALANP
jgi:hypothetical protein